MSTPTDIFPVKAQSTLADMPIMETTDDPVPIDDLGALNQKMNAVLSYPDLVDLEVTSMKPFKQFGGAGVPSFEFAILNDKSGRDIVVSGWGQQVDVTVNLYGDAAGTTSASTSIGAGGIWSVTLSRSAVTSNFYMYGDVEFTGTGGGGTPYTHGLSVRQDNSDPAGLNALQCGYQKIADGALRGGGDVYDVFITKRLADNVEALAIANACRTGKMWSVLTPDGSSYGKVNSTSLAYTIGWTTLRYVGPFDFRAGPYEDQCAMLVRLRDGGAGYNERIKLYVRNVDANWTSAPFTVSTGGDDYVYISGIQCIPGAKNQIFLGAQVSPEAVPDSEVDAGKANISTMFTGGVGANLDFEGSSHVMGMVADRWAVLCSQKTPEVEENDPTPVPFTVHDVCYFTEDSDGSTEYFELDPIPLKNGDPYLSAIARPNDYANFTLLRVPKNYAILKSVHIMGTPTVPVDHQLPLEAPSATAALDIYEAVNKIAARNVGQLGCMPHGGHNMRRPSSLGMESGTASYEGTYVGAVWSPNEVIGAEDCATVGFGNWTVCRHLGDTPGRVWTAPAVWFCSRLPYNHTSSTDDYSEVSRLAFARLHFQVGKRQFKSFSRNSMTINFKLVYWYNNEMGYDNWDSGFIGGGGNTTPDAEGPLEQVEFNTQDFLTGNDSAQTEHVSKTNRLQMARAVNNKVSRHYTVEPIPGVAVLAAPNNYCAAFAEEVSSDLHESYLTSPDLSLDLRDCDGGRFDISPEQGGVFAILASFSAQELSHDAPRLLSVGGSLWFSDRTY